MKIEQLRTYKRILILGYGIEGHATEQFIRKFHPEAEIGIADQKDGEDYLLKQADYDLAIRTPLLRPKYLTIPYTTGTRLFMANSKHKKIGITGTKGKSTAVSLLHHIMKSSGRNVVLHGNIGEPMINILTRDVTTDTTCILEMSSYQLEDCEYSPNVACFLNIYHETHNHDSYEEYLHAKYNIATHQSPQDTFFYNGSISDVKACATLTQGTAVDFSSENIEQVLDVESLPFTTHLDTLRAVWALCKHEGISAGEFATHCMTFTPLKHRLTHLGEYANRHFYDDSASIHPSSTILALNSIRDIDVLIVGGDDRGYELHELADDLASKQIPTLVCMGETGAMLSKLINDRSDYSPQIVVTNSLQEAVQVAYTHTQPGHACVLSSGAPSYGLFANLQERGDTFARLVDEYAQTSDLTHS